MRRQAITRTSDDLLLIRQIDKNFREIWIKKRTFFILNTKILLQGKFRLQNIAGWRLNFPASRCLLSRLFRRRSKKTSKLPVIGLCEGYSPVTSQRASKVENVSIWWRHHTSPEMAGGCCNSTHGIYPPKLHLSSNLVKYRQSRTLHFSRFWNNHFDKLALRDMTMSPPRSVGNFKT